eukprot:1137082-Pelagomonas_calceolata.AAC.2
MATAADLEIRERWRWSACNEMAVQGHLSGFGDDLVQAWLEENLTTALVGVVPKTLENQIHTLNTESEKHSTNSFICRNNNHAFAIKKYFFGACWTRNLHPRTSSQRNVLLKLVEI